MLEEERYAHMPLTLEQHFARLAAQNSEVEQLHSLWVLLRKDLEEQLPLSRGNFVHYSLHDATHSRSVIHAIERFLGDDRIVQLSATDTFMLLCCAYAHDYGMAMTFSQIYETLGNPDFETFLKEQEKNEYGLGQEEIQAVRNLLVYLDEAHKLHSTLQDQYSSIITAIQMYLRPLHWKGVNRVWEEFKGLLGGRLGIRFIQGGEGIIDICQAHGKDFSSVLDMQPRADGIVGDNFHPRFIAAMLRLGDLLDLDNGRFPRWFVDEISRNRALIPQLSKLHYQKHESVSHLLITPKRIEVCASCSGKHAYEVADLVSEWLEWLDKECREQTLHWSEIAQPDFGRPPTVTKKEILVYGKPYNSQNHKLQMRMSQDRVMKLLEGTSIYQDQYVGIRELLQNAVDASLLQLWDDIKHNRYLSLRLSKHGHRVNMDGIELEQPAQEMGMLEHGPEILNGLFGNYDITIELILDRVAEKVYVVVKDKGIGITPEDAAYISDIGSSKEKNERILDIKRDMPRWLQPSGVFGIGLQSVFQLTDRIEFYTRRPNEPERLIVFHSYGRNFGKIEIREVLPNPDGIYNDNAVPGTNVKIAIDPKKLLRSARYGADGEKDRFLYYDAEFDTDDPLKILFVELSHVITEKLEESPLDYFNIHFQTLKHYSADQFPVKEKCKRLRCSYFAPFQDTRSKDKNQLQLQSMTIFPFFSKTTHSADHYTFTERTAHLIDDTLCRIHRVELRPCTIHKKDGKSMVELPVPRRDLYHLQYKFNPISNVEALYPPTVRKLRNVHAGFLEWYINIMDDDPTKYLNIDRDRLREGALMEEELGDIRTALLERWCDYFIARHTVKEDQRADTEKKGRSKYKKQGTEEQFQPAPPVNLFQDKLDLLISIALLFYQNVRPDQFRAFIALYADFIKEQKLTLLGENFPVELLWDETVSFSISQAYPPQLNPLPPSPEKNPNEAGQSLHLDTVLRLPHRLVHIDEISRTEANDLVYRLHLGPSSQTPCAIEMDYSARFLDYLGVLDAAFVNPKEIDTTALVRRVFKPNSKFPSLIINRFPKNFKRDQNFSSPLDHCIRWYILSPFERDMCKWLKKAVIKDRRDTDTLLKECKIQADAYTENNEHFQKCVRYVFMQHTALAQQQQTSLPEHLEQTIKKQYKDFLLDCCQILIEQRDLIKRYFAG